MPTKLIRKALLSTNDTTVYRTDRVSSLHPYIFTADDTVKLENAEDVVLTLINAVGAKDEYTEGHVQRLANYATAIGKRLRLSHLELQMLRYGALLHDVGKIGVAEQILCKAGPLTTAERYQMQQHTIIGERIIAPLSFAATVGPIVRHHHEQWDGHGYPDRLAGTDIPLGARIVAVADAFDAMTTQRPYNHVRSFADATNCLHEGVGTWWDPQVVEVFLAWLRVAHDLFQPTELTYVTRGGCS